MSESIQLSVGMYLHTYAFLCEPSRVAFRDNREDRWLLYKPITINKLTNMLVDIQRNLSIYTLYIPYMPLTCRYRNTYIRNQQPIYRMHLNCTLILVYFLTTIN